MHIAAGAHPPTPASSTGHRAVIVLGMHRSGTSCLTGSLQARGLYLGDVQQANPHNRKGNRESLRIMHLNDAVLAHSQGAWDRPPDAVAWTDEHAAERDAIIAEFEQAAPAAWGFKDPRTVLTLPFWREGLPQARLVGSFRHPADVARSLHARSRFPVERAFELWLAYNQVLLREHAREPFPLISFDLDAAAYRQELERLAASLALHAVADEQADFFEASLRKPQAARQQVPGEVNAAYLALKTAASRWTR
jgi:hypothetical protein